MVIDAHAACPVAELLGEIAGVVEPLVAEKGLTLATDPAPPSAFVRGDRDRIAQILLNLLSNAVKCTDAGGAIRLSCENGGDRVMIHVRDTADSADTAPYSKSFDPVKG